MIPHLEFKALLQNVDGKWPRHHIKAELVRLLFKLLVHIGFWCTCVQLKHKLAHKSVNSSIKNIASFYVLQHNSLAFPLSYLCT